MFRRGSQDWVIAKIGRHKSLLWDIPEAALAKYQSLDAMYRAPLNSRATATVLNCFVLDEAERLFSDQFGSEFEKRNGTTYHLLKGCVLWYKQLGSDGMPSNYPTPTAQDMMQGNFAFMPERILLVIGFQLDEAQLKVIKVEIQRFNTAGSLEYYIELEKVIAKPRLVEMPTQINDGLVTRTKIKIKRGPEQNELLAQENE